MKKILSIVVGLLIVGGFAVTGNLDKLQQLVGEPQANQPQSTATTEPKTKPVEQAVKPKLVQTKAIETKQQPKAAKVATSEVKTQPQPKKDNYGFRDEGICGSAPRVKGKYDKNLLSMAKRQRLQFPYTFVNVTNTVNQTGRLPSCYLTKRQAEDRGWSRGRDLWNSSPGHSIGGNRFGNYEGRLPKNVGQFVEADIDFDGDRRGAKRLVFVKNSKNRWLQWLTVDHYDSFQKVDPR